MDKIMVKKEHIQKGIDRYNGQPDAYVQRLLDDANWNYTAYRFQDNRMLLVYPEELFAVLYKNQDVLFEEMDKTT